MLEGTQNNLAFAQPAFIVQAFLSRHDSHRRMLLNHAVSLASFVYVCTSYVCGYVNYVYPRWSNTRTNAESILDAEIIQHWSS